MNIAAVGPTGERGFMATRFCVPERHDQSLALRPLDNAQILVGAGLIVVAFLFLIAPLAG
jgi:hypothetical protein